MAAELSWTEMFGRMQAVGFSTVYGRIRYRTPSGSGVKEGEAEFWHQPPEKWRVEDEQGLRAVLSRKVAEARLGVIGAR